jgi:hypothetical protein
MTETCVAKENAYNHYKDYRDGMTMLRFEGVNIFEFNREELIGIVYSLCR